MWSQKHNQKSSTKTIKVLTIKHYCSHSTHSALQQTRILSNKKMYQTIFQTIFKESTHQNPALPRWGPEAMRSTECSDRWLAQTATCPAPLIGPHRWTHGNQCRWSSPIKLAPLFPFLLFVKLLQNASEQCMQARKAGSPQTNSRGFLHKKRETSGRPTRLKERAGMSTVDNCPRGFPPFQSVTSVALNIYNWKSPGTKSVAPITIETGARPIVNWNRFLCNE